MQPESRWLVVEACPACGSAREVCSSTLRVGEYRHGDERIPLPLQGVRLVTCGECGLAFKDVMPSPSFLAEVFARHVGEMCAIGYDFAEEAKLVRDLVDSNACDILDVGASEGGLLRALHDLQGRRSALDIVMNPALGPSLRFAAPMLVSPSRGAYMVAIFPVFMTGLFSQPLINAPLVYVLLLAQFSTVVQADRKRWRVRAFPKANTRGPETKGNV